MSLPELDHNFYFCILLTALLLIGIVFTSYLAVHTSKETAKIETHLWSRWYDVEQFQTLICKGRSYPNDARVLNEWTVNDDHYDFINEKWVWDSHVEYQYEIDRWVKVRDIAANGADKNPYWPDVKGLTKDAPSQLGIERLASSYEKYELKLLAGDPEEILTYELTFKEWSELKTGELILLDINGFGTIKTYSRIEAE